MPEPDPELPPRRRPLPSAMLAAGMLGLAEVIDPPRRQEIPVIYEDSRAGAEPGELGLAFEDGTVVFTRDPHEPSA